ncbi:hypothetical protein [Nocardia asiatica]|uniref:hypothetical protein n=1 Tax=Nocardia TaxID=1817 RepID=UPI002456C9B7|nr:hypothetical protein [Nocardia asiatica]
MFDRYNIAARLPEFNDDPVQRLAHTVAAYTNRTDDDWVVIATRNAIPGHFTTGITWGDLRALLARLQGDSPA